MCASETPHVICCADEAYALPLATMVRSLLANHDGEAALTVVDAGIRGRTRERLRRSWPEIEPTWVKPRFDRLRGAPLSGHASAANYVRLLMEDLLPQTVERVLYLDVDLLVLGDVQALWDLPLDGAPCLAAQDAVLTHVDLECAPNIELARPHLLILDPIRNYRELGLDGAAKYFNTGVLLIDVALWREEQLGAELLRCLAENRKHVRLWDQYVLNVVLSGRWGELHPRWNAQIMVHDYPGWRESPYDQTTYDEVLGEPRVVHFAAAVKPWQHGWQYPYADLFFEYVDQTEWAGWRPRRPLFGLHNHRWVRSVRKRTRRLTARMRRRGG